jgi:hypothetical protein
MTEQEFFDRLAKTKEWGWLVTEHGFIRCRIQCSDSLACPITAVAATSMASMKHAGCVNTCSKRLEIDDSSLVSAIVQGADNVVTLSASWQLTLNAMRDRLLKTLGLSERTDAK